MPQLVEEDGNTVVDGDVMSIMEAMKMETRLAAAKAGRIDFKVEQGTVVGLGKN